MKKHNFLIAFAVLAGYATEAQNLPVTVSGPSSIYQTVSVSVNELSLEKALKVFPNPASSYLEIRLDSDYEFNGSELFIQDVQGRVVFTEQNIKFTDNALRISTKQLSPGVYTLYVKSDKKVLAYKKFAINSK